MCEFCTKHGEGKKWYLNAKNYSDDLLSDLKRRKFTEGFFHWVDRTYKQYFGLFKKLPVRMPIIGPSLKAIIKQIFVYEHWGQVIPIEDIERIFTITKSITRVPCICRKTTTGKEVRTCFLISLDSQGMGIANIIDKSFFGGPDVAKFEKISKEDALAFMKESEKSGSLHTIWTLRAPFIGALCNCDDTGCIAMKSYREVTPIFFKSEYVAIVDKDRCGGCKACIKICPFTAVGYDTAGKKAKIDFKKCYGCGICRAVCKKDAIALEDRRHIAEVANSW